MAKKEIKKRKVPFKLLIFLAGLLLCFLVIVSITYINQYTKNTPIVFDQKVNKLNIKKLEESKYFDFKIVSIAYEPKRTNSTNKGNMEIDARLFLKSNVSEEAISKVKIQYQTASHWVDISDESSNSSISSNYYIRNENKTLAQQTFSRTISLSKIMPVKPLLFVTISRPDLYIKLSYEYKTATDEEGTEHNEYFKLSARQWKDIYSENY